MTESAEVTVAIALPAYVGRTNVASPLISVTSDRGATSSFTATRGMKFLPLLDAGAMICE